MLASGVKIIKTSDELNRRFLKAYDEIVATNVAKDDFYKKVVDSQKKYSERGGALPPLVLAELQLHRGALLQGQDLAEVADR